MTLTFDQNINVASLVGTWLGPLFTLLGLLAVFTQVRALLKTFSNNRDERVRNAAGAWASCLGTLRGSDSGVVEGIAPSVTPWIRNHYSNGKNIRITPLERQLSGGTASWSKLFARLQIKPDELNRVHELDSRRHLVDPMTMWSGPTRPDLLVEGDKISYGLHGDEFAALLILGGFSPSDFHVSKTSSHTGHLGHMHLGPLGPFSQIAQLDGSWKRLFDLHPGLHEETLGRYIHQVNVRCCIDLALGIFRFYCLGHHRAVVLPADELVPAAVNEYFAKPSSRRLLAVRRNLTHLTGGEVAQNHLFDLDRASHFKFKDIFSRERAWKTALNSFTSFQGINLYRTFIR
ncbi:hypothetical protein N431DRAFT_551821 [Stipitochalara longipes BDJ]|nr:hypothetical protein N431DRAFT_551821 [Stipitochalara longipes BDJ]